MSSNKQTTITIAATSDFKQRVQKLAQAEGISVSRLITEEMQPSLALGRLGKGFIWVHQWQLAYGR